MDLTHSPSVATDLLNSEHRTILSVLDVLDAACSSFEAGEAVPANVVPDLVRFFREYADDFHHAKEENILFLRYHDRGMPRGFGPVAVMMHEHDAGREHLAAFERAFAAGNRAATALAGRDFSGLLRAHIDKEDEVLYPMGNRILSADDQAWLLREFDRVARERFGAAALADFDALVNRLTKQLF